MLPAEDTKLEHFGGRQLRSKLGIEVAEPVGLHERIDITLLHPVFHGDSADAHWR